jgi:ribosomal protein S18 acetylase RimI-like enzyme
LITTGIHRLTETEIYTYLLENDQIFIPCLTSRVNLLNYATKLNKFADHFCAFFKDRLIGFLGCYFNDPKNNIAFISTLSVNREFQRRGVAKKLLETTIIYGFENGFKQMKLSVHKSNISAITLYSEAGFLELSRSLNQLEMALDLKKRGLFIDSDIIFSNNRLLKL